MLKRLTQILYQITKAGNLSQDDVNLTVVFTVVTDNYRFVKIYLSKNFSFSLFQNTPKQETPLNTRTRNSEMRKPCGIQLGSYISSLNYRDEKRRKAHVGASNQFWIHRWI